MMNSLTKLVLATILATAFLALTNGTPLPKYLTEDDEIMAEGMNELDLQIATELNKPRYKTNPLRVQLDWIRSKLIKYSDNKAKLAKLLDITMASLNDTQQEYNGLMNENYRRDPMIQQDVYFYGQLLKSYKNIARGIYNQKASIYDGPTIRFEPKIFYVVFAFALYFLAIWVVYKYGGYLYGQCCRTRPQQRAAARRNNDGEVEDARNLLQENSPRSRSPIRPVFCLATPDSNSPRREAEAEVHVEELEMSSIGPDQDEELVESPISPLSADDFHPLKTDCAVELFPEDSPKQAVSSVENVEPQVPIEETEIQIQGDPIDV